MEKRGREGLAFGLFFVVAGFERAHIKPVVVPRGGVASTSLFWRTHKQKLVDARAKPEHDEKKNSDWAGTALTDGDAHL